MMKFAGEFEAIFSNNGFMLPEQFAEILCAREPKQLLVCKTKKEEFWTIIEHTERELADLLREFEEIDYVPISEEIFVIENPTTSPWHITLPAFVINSLGIKKGDVVVVVGLKYRIEFTKKCFHLRAVEDAMRRIRENPDLMKEFGF